MVKRMGLLTMAVRHLLWFREWACSLWQQDVCCGSEYGFVDYGSKMFVVVQRMGLLAVAVRCLLWF